MLARIALNRFKPDPPGMCGKLVYAVNNREFPSINDKSADILVSIVVINRNGHHHLRTLFPALINNTQGIHYELIIVDNASTDDSIPLIQSYSKELSLKLIKNKKNESFSVANNQAVKMAEGKYIVLLNNDIEPLQGWLNYLVDSAESQANIGSVGARLVYPDIKRPFFRNPFKKRPRMNCLIQHAGIAYNDEKILFRPYNVGKGKVLNDASVLKNEPKSALTAACLLVPKAVYLEVGGLDERFVYGGEDVDFGLKLLKAGYVNLYCSDAVLFHHEFGTQGRQKRKEAALRRQKNLEVFQKKWFLQIKKSYWNEKIFGGSHLFAESPLTIVLPVMDAGRKSAPDVLLANALKHHLETFGWKIILLNKKEGEWYDMGETIDVVCVLQNEYDLTRLPDRPKRLIKVAWISDLLGQYRNSSWWENFDFSVEEETDIFSGLKRQHNPLFKNDVQNSRQIHSEIKNRVNDFREALIQRYLRPSIAIKIPVTKWKRAQSWGDYHMAVLLKQQLEKKGHHVLLQILPEWDDDEGMEYDVAIVFRGLSRYKLKPHQINIMWNISHPDSVSLEEYEEYDKVFVASDFWARKIAKQVSVPVETMLQCTDPERFKEPTLEEKRSHRQQLLFVGNSRDIYRKVLKDLLPTDYDLAVYGKNWNKLIPGKYIKAEHLPNDELYRYYGSADILLNDHWQDMREKGFISNRIFDGLACGAFIITDRVVEMGLLEEFVQVYDTPDELNQQIAYYLVHPDERLKKAHKGKSYVCKHHTFEVRARQFSDSIKALLKITD